MIPEIRNHSYHQQIKDHNLISLVQKEDCEDKWLKCFNTWIDSQLPVQYGSSIMTLLTEQETMEKNLLYNIKITTTWNALPN